MKYSSGKEIHMLVLQLIREGWSFGRGAKHGWLRPPVGPEVLTVPNSPSDRRAFLNFRQDVRRMRRLCMSASMPVVLNFH
jgi:hypothetical protein